jgi:hypothetical protein
MKKMQSKKQLITDTSKELSTDCSERSSLLSDYVMDVIQILEVNIAVFNFYNYVFFDYRGLHIQEALNEDDVSTHTCFMECIYQPDPPILVVANMTRIVDHRDFQGDKVFRFVELTEAERLYSAAKKLRVAWQLKYHRELYFDSNLQLNDNAVVDAYAFALAYTLSPRTPFTEADLPALFEPVSLNSIMNQEKYRKRARQISAAYRFDLIHN